MTQLVLASRSKYRASVLRDAGFTVELRPPTFDEQAHRQHLQDLDVGDYARSLALGKADSVPPGLDEIVIAGDQVGVLDIDGSQVELTQQPTVEQAVQQLHSMSGTTHRLVNAIVCRRQDLEHPEGVVTRSEVDTHYITMRPFSEKDARLYVEKFLPLDTAGSYRIEDDADLIHDVQGSGIDGVMGMPISVLKRLLSGWHPGSNETHHTR